MDCEVKRININVPFETLEKVDDYAKRMTINRTAAILVLLNQALDQQNILQSVISQAIKDSQIVANDGK